MKIAFIAGTSINNSHLFDKWELNAIDNLFYRYYQDKIIINRHGYSSKKSPPHNINYQYYIRRIKHLGFTEIISLNSVGSLHQSLPPGTIVSCSDYVCLQQAPKTLMSESFDKIPLAPGFTNNLIPTILEKLPEFSILPNQVYVQMAGPRFETKAEVKVIKAWGDVVGMTAAHEADICAELGMNYNSLAIIDNYANGINDEEINFEKFDKLVLTNQLKVDRLFSRLLEIFS